MEAELHLKQGAPVMLLHNLSATLVNGCQGVLDRAEGEQLYITVDSGQRVPVSRVTRTRYCPNTLQPLASRTQFPVKAAFGMTIHKAQGTGFKVLLLWAEFHFLCSHSLVTQTISKP